MLDVAKCDITCNKSDTCVYGRSTGSPMNFKYYCINQDKYSEWFEGPYREYPDIQTDEAIDILGEVENDSEEATE